MNPAEIAQYLIPNAGQQFQGNDFRQLREPGVYVFVLNGQALYVGYSNKLLGRIGQAHRQASRAIEECDQVLVYPCKSVRAAQQLELLLITALKPAYNRYQRRDAVISSKLGVKHYPVQSPVSPLCSSDASLQSMCD